jgi:cytochrome c biogenesis protein
MLKAVSPAGDPVLAPVRVAEEGTAKIPGTDLSVEVVATAENYNGFGPAAQLVLVAEGPNSHAHVGEPFVVLQNFPNFDQRRGGEQVFQLAGLLPGRWYTGLQVAKDPGVPLIWAGSLLLTLGTLMAFFASHRRVWVRLEGGRLTLAGAAAKNPSAFREAFEELERALRERTELTSRAQRATG